jgi:hypothetical protein
LVAKIKTSSKIMETKSDKTDLSKLLANAEKYFKVSQNGVKCSMSVKSKGLLVEPKMERNIFKHLTSTKM